MRVAVKQQHFEDPGWVKQLLGNPAFGFGWFLVRLYLGFQWLEAGWHKIYGDSSIGWVKDGTVNGTFVNGGDSLLGFWHRAAAVPQTGKPTISYGWYRDFLQYMIDHGWNGWFTYLISYGEFLIGVALIVGAFTGIAAFLGATMNFNFMLAGTASTNPVLFILAILMILTWKTAGYVGVDRWMLPLLGTPWQPGRMLHRAQAPNAQPRGHGRTGVTGAGL